MTVLIDSWAWIEFFQGSRAGSFVMGYLDGDSDLIISTVNLAEVYCWILRYYDESTAEKKREAMKERCTLIDVDEEIAVQAARIRNQFKWGLGNSIVCATARREAARVLTGDQDYRGQDDVIFLDRP